jgi:hypothetical protein
MVHPIPSFYRIFFTSIDPLVALSGGYLNFFDSHTVITSMFPPTHTWSNRTPAHHMLLHQLGGAFFMMAFLMVFMLRCTKDVNIWKLFEAGILITDFGMFYSMWMALGAQKRLSIGDLRWEEWGSITGFVTVVRMLFLMEVGFKKTKEAKKYT